MALSLTVYGRLIALEVRDGSDYRAVAAEPIVRRQRPPAMRGRILAHDGTVLAYDEALMSLAVQYRWLEEPADPRWLRQTARSQLPPRTAPQRQSGRRKAGTNSPPAPRTGPTSRGPMRTDRRAVASPLS